MAVNGSHLRRAATDGLLPPFISLLPVSWLTPRVISQPAPLKTTHGLTIDRPDGSRRLGIVSLPCRHHILRQSPQDAVRGMPPRNRSSIISLAVRWAPRVRQEWTPDDGVLALPAPPRSCGRRGVAATRGDQI